MLIMPLFWVFVCFLKISTSIVAFSSSKLPFGSSANINDAGVASDRAIATRCFCHLKFDKRNKQPDVNQIVCFTKV